MASVIPCTGPSDTSSTTGTTGARVGFSLISTSSSRISSYACYSVIIVGANCVIGLFKLEKSELQQER